MPILNAADAVVFNIPGVTFTGLASPSRGSMENSVWKVNLHPHCPGHPHQLTREEVFVVTDGQALATVGSTTHELHKGSVLIVPAHTDFALANPFPEPFEAVVVFPVGGQAIVANQPPFTPPWAA
jgi:quercetin dioxygenase-like cupin family protein